MVFEVAGDVAEDDLHRLLDLPQKLASSLFLVAWLLHVGVLYLYILLFKL